MNLGSPFNITTSLRLPELLVRAAHKPNAMRTPDKILTGWVSLTPPVTAHIRIVDPERGVVATRDFNYSSELMNLPAIAASVKTGSLLMTSADPCA